MFRPTTKHNIPAGPSSSGQHDVKINRRNSGMGSSSRYPYRLNLCVQLTVAFVSLMALFHSAIQLLRPLISLWRNLRHLQLLV